MKYKNDNYFFFINNNKDIIDMTNIIVNDILNKDKYNISALKEEILKKINRSFNKTYTIEAEEELRIFLGDEEEMSITVRFNILIFS